MMIASQRNSHFMLLLILACSLRSPQAAAQAHGQTSDREPVLITHTPDAGPVLSDHAKRQLSAKLETGVTTPLQVVDADGAPLEINGAKATSIRIEGNYDAPASAVAMINDYATTLNFRLVNRSDRPVDGVVLEFTNTQEPNTFYLHLNREEVKGGNTIPMIISVGESKRIRIPFIAVTGDPAYLSVQVAGAHFGDGTTWPFPQSRRSSAVPKSGSSTNVQQVDSKPRLLNSPQPRYTEDARRNHVGGSVNLQIMVGVDGSVKRVNVANALPDGLTEAAIRAAYEMKFEPARKNGEPVDYWLPVEVEFNLK